MAPKKAPPSKAEQKQRVKVAEDKTFGLKNKNKSKQVQKFVQSVQKAAIQPNAAVNKEKEEKKKKKLEEEARQRELDKLFKVVPKKDEKKDDTVPNPDDPYAHLKKEGEAEEEYLWTADDFDAVETDESRLEEQLEKELEKLRADLAQNGGGTPVNPATFAEWKEKQHKLKIEREKKNKDKMKQTGKYTGRALFEVNSALFVDDEDGIELYEKESEHDEEREEVEVEEGLFDGGDLAVEDVEE